MDRFKNCIQKTNTAIEHAFQRLGYFVADRPKIILAVNLSVLLLLTLGLFNFQTESNIFDLWTPTDSEVWAENEFIDEYWSDKDYGLVVVAAYAKTGFDQNIMSTEYLDEWYDLHLDFAANLPKIEYTYNDDDGVSQTITMGYWMENYYDPEELDVLANLSGKVVPHYASEVVPLCRHFATSPLEAQFELPCYLLSLFDCFSEGGYTFPYENYLEKSYFASLYPTNAYTEKPSYQGMSTIELGAALAPSCTVWSGTLVPFNYIYGGDTRTDSTDDTSQLTEVRSFETISYVDSPFGIARKIKIAKGECTYTSFYSIDCDEPTEDEKAIAEELLDDWLAEFIDYMGDYTTTQDNDDTKLLKVVYWTPRTASDLLIEASSADFFLLGVAYVTMIVFASLTAFKPRDLFLSRAEASCAGVILVLLAVIATMGTGALFLKFSPNVIQVLPFIALGFGVDDMFVLLFSFKFRETCTIRDMIGDATRVAGSSVAMTSMSNFFAFLIAAFMVLPDVARFAQFGLIIVCLNFFTVLFGFAAILSLTATRMAQRYKDFSYLCCFPECMKAGKTKSQRRVTAHIFDPFFDCMVSDWTRVLSLLAFFGLIGLGIYGCTLAKLGLPLQDIVPEDSYASDFLQVRSEFYFSYVVSLYTDADGADLTPIDWENKFETWIDVTKSVTDISSLVYTDLDVHDFWAWGMQEYLQEKWSDYFEPWPLQTLDTTETTTIAKSPYCEYDRITKCPSELANYTYGSSLYNCLMYSYDFLNSSDCGAYLDLITPVGTNTTTIAKQVQLIISGGGSSGGLYVTSSSDTTNVYYKYSGKGIIYQAEDDSWVVLDSGYNPVYFAPTTETGSQPPQYGWTDSSGSLVATTLVYWDTDFEDYFRSGEIFISNDVSEPSSFEFLFEFDASSDNDGSCYAMEAMRLSMGENHIWDGIEFDSDVGQFGDYVACDAYVETGNLCNAIKNEDDVGTIKCGSFFEDRIGSLNSSWWIGDCNNNGWTITASNETILNLDNTTACSCSQETFTDINGVLNYLSPCASQIGSSEWGGFGVNDGSDSCSNTNQNISLTCTSTDCTGIDSCFEDFSILSEANADQCAGNVWSIYARFNEPKWFRGCLLTNYYNVSSCCQSAIVELFVLNEEYSCGELESNGADGELCTIRDTCDTNCDPICYDDMNGNCANAIGTYCYDYWLSGNNTGLATCLRNLKDEEAGQCCYEYLKESYDDDCIIAEDGYYIWGTNGRYDYSACTDTDISDAECGTTYDDTLDQLFCLINNITSIDDLSCCWKVLKQINANFYFTHDCQQETHSLCNGGPIQSWEADQGCLDDLDTFKGLNALSPYCNISLNYCYEDGTWPLTKVGNTVELSCDSGYSGKKQRTCKLAEFGHRAEWSLENDTNCEILYCPTFTDEDGIQWNQTDVFNIRSVFGYWTLGYAFEQDVLACGGGSSTAFPYTQRQCKLNDTGSNAYWSNRIDYCRAIYSFWKFAEVHNDSYCDPTTESLIAYIDPGDTYTEYARQVEYCEDVCALGVDHCEGYLLDNEIMRCYFYDWCDLLDYDITSQDQIDAGNYKSRYVWTYQPLSLSEYAAEDCSADNAAVATYEAWNADGIPDPNCFNRAIYQYFVDPTGGTLYRDKIYFNNIEYLYDDDVPRLNDVRIISTYNSFAVRGVDDDEVAVELILAIRKSIKNDYTSNELYVIPGGLVFDLYSQYVGVEEYLILNLIYVSIAVMICGFIFLLQPWAVVVCLACNAAMVVEVYGFVEWMGLRVNGVLVLNIVIAVGLTMEFTAHMSRAFVLTDATKKDFERTVTLPHASVGQIRLKKTMREMFNPVTLGAITTFLGVLPISAAKFPYFRQYYFVLYVVVVLFGWLNGVFFQPIILSWFPPPTFDVTPLADEIKPLTQSTNENGAANTNKSGTATADEQKSDVEDDGDETGDIR